ncbi:rhamnogalacturonan lyase family protein [Paenibacillus sp. SYP-B4298]|uniref:rhamnogalacturonan lyase family protein n=1 Tax=Paenibacillus sp. SYP-B4298 TaxID=2996034 RepID=UPI0022DCEA58|nr:S-layer homology domain-containing protein [Paenibacillus sp. SYP-B4298]
MIRASHRYRRYASLLVFLLLFSSLQAAIPVRGVHAEETETRTAWRFDFGGPTSPVMEGYEAVYPGLLYTTERGYGVDERADNFRHRAGTLNDLLSDFLLSGGFTFKVDVPNGKYKLNIYTGDPIGTGTTRARLSIGSIETGGLTSPAGQVTSHVFEADATEGQLMLDFSTWHANSGGVYINAIEIDVMEDSEPEPEQPGDQEPGPLPDGDVIRLDFGPGAAEESYLQVQASTAYTAERKYGFVNPAQVSGVNRGGADALRSDFVMVPDAEFRVDLPNADYSVSLIAGDAEQATEIAIKAEEMQKVQLTTREAGSYLEMSFDIALIDGQLTLAFSGAAPKLNALVITRKAARSPGDVPRVYLAGDSTVQTYDPYWEPQAGWGQMIEQFFSDAVSFENHAIGGRSSKTFITEGRLDAVLQKIRPGDYFLIQFGHNDSTISRPERYASPADYKVYLKTHLDGARQRGATPILVTPMGRRDFNEATGTFNVSFPDYVQAMKEVAMEQGVALVDLSALSVAYYNSIGPEASRSVFLHVPPGIYQAFPNGSEDNTHFQEYGAIQIARLLATGIQALNIPLSAHVQELAPPDSVPAQPTGLIAGSISNAGAVLKWNATEHTDIYRIYRKRAADAQYTLVGTSTVPTAELSGMAEGQSYLVRITAVNGKGESEPSSPITITTKAAQYRYDFGPVGSPVAPGYIGVTRSTIYSPELGYGLVSSAGMADRDRGGATDALRRDFVIYFGGSYEFKVDLPNGYYAVKTYTGDWIGSTRTEIHIEGKSYGTVTSGKENIAEKVFTMIPVRDGQMNLVFSGQTAHLNGLEITPILLAPAGLKLEQVKLDEDPAEAKLSWVPSGDAAKYRIYRQASGAAAPEQIAETVGASYTDQSASIGLNYLYSVTALDASGLESVPSIAVQVAMIDETVSKPAVPTGLTAAGIAKERIDLQWQAAQGARFYQVYRSKKAAGPYELHAQAAEPSYSDTTVLTTIPYYYKVAAVNAGGISQLSTALETEAVTTLVRDMERLDRAPVAIRTEQGNYIGWRMLGLDPDSIAFHVYRDGERLTSQPITDSTNYVDPTGNENASYTLSAILNGVERPVTEPFGVWQQQYLSVPLQKPADGYTKDGQPYTYYAGDASTGDLDGDGELEIVMLWSPSNAKDNSQAGYTGIVYMDAYKLDGTRLWRINLGPNIRAGAHYTQFMVYDLDGDGRAEVAFKTADGTVDGLGKVIGKPDADHRNSSGYVLLGDEFLTVFDGQTGGALATVPYDPPRGDVAAWGDSYGNRVDRFLGAIAYLDGERPSLVMSRGYYTRTVLAAYNFRDGQLTKLWRFDTDDEGYGDYAGQGNHGISVGDVDGDGKDEITFGAMAIDDDGTPLYNTRLGHGDAMHLGNLDPSRPGLEVFGVHENVNAEYGMEMRDAATGEILWGVFTGIDTGRGMSADIDPRYPGEEVWAATITNAQHIPVTGLYTAKGELISTTIPSSTNFGIWWDGDLLRELQDDIRIDKWDWTNSTTKNLLTATGAASNNSTKANPMLQADLLGDWREEVVWRSADSSELRIYSTTDVTEHRIRTLMHDPIYRLGVAWQNVSYNQPPHPGFYLGHGMEMPPMPSIRYAGDQAVGEVEVSSVSGAATVRAGSSLQMKASIRPAEATNKEVIWSVHSVDGSPTELAMISYQGQLQALKPGAVIVKAEATDGSRASGQASITIQPPASMYYPSAQSSSPSAPAVPEPQKSGAASGSGELTLRLEGTDDGRLALSAAELRGAVEGGKSLTIRVDGKPGSNGVKLELALEGWQQGDAKPSSVVLKTDWARLELPLDALLRQLEQQNGKAASRLTIELMREEDDALRIMLLADGQRLEQTAAYRIGLPYQLQPGEQPEQAVAYKRQADGSDQPVRHSRFVSGLAEIELWAGAPGAYMARSFNGSFSDIAQASWAEAPIRLLAARGIVDGYSDGRFRPNEQVTRAAYVKLLLLALELDGTEGGSSFSDVASNAWHAGYIATAHQLGIVQGNPAGQIKPDDPISRQEMAVMTARAAEAAGIELAGVNESPRFTDSGDIADYAAEAIADLQAAGLIRGKQDGRFAPKEPTTRAEAAQLVARLWELRTRG